MLSCRDSEYAIEEGNIVLFNPGDSHALGMEDILRFAAANGIVRILTDIHRE